VVLTKAAGSRFDPVTQIFIYTRDRDSPVRGDHRDHGTARTQRARRAGLYSSADHHTLDTFFVLEQDGRPVPPERLARRAPIRQSADSSSMTRATEHYLDVVQRHTPRALKHFTRAHRDAPH
jgi:[protein-PII] uridylyltransferase